MTMKRVLFGLLVLLVVSGAYAQQDELTCGALVDMALTSTTEECSDMEANSVCVGSVVISDGATSLEPGSALSANDVSTIRSSALDLDAGAFGIVAMNVADATLLLFGEAELENLSADIPSIDVQVSHPTGSFARETPSADSAVVSPLFAGQLLAATGRMEDSTWIRVAVPGSGTGWVSASAIRVVNELDDLDDVDVVEADAPIDLLYRPMRDLKLRTGLNDAPCPPGFESGLLVQTPDETGMSLALNINNRIVQVMGTAFIQAPTDETLFVTVLEGEASVSHDGRAVPVVEPEQLVVASEVQVNERDYARMEMLPLHLLPRRFTMTVTWEEAIIPAQNNPLAGITPEDPCTITVVNDVNVRTGPGLEYPLRGTMLANQSAKPDGRAIGTEGEVWWRLTAGAWLRFDVAFNVGTCSDLPMIEAIPRR